MAQRFGLSLANLERRKLCCFAVVPALLVGSQRVEDAPLTADKPLHGVRHSDERNVVLHSAAAVAGSYYVDCSGGDDGADGTTPATAWGTVAAVNARTFTPGDTILLRRGTTCAGMLAPRGSGSPGAAIIVGAYDVGPRPIIDGGSNTAAIRLFNQEYWEIRSIETTGGTPYGILVSGDKSDVLDHVRITDMLVHDVGGQVDRKETGLIVVTPGSAETTFNDVLIEGVTAHTTTQWAGILVGGAQFGNTPFSPRSTNVTIRHSTVHGVYGDGIILYQVNDGVIETSVAYETGNNPSASVGTPNGIWTWMCSRCTVQFTEGYLTDSPGVDGGIYDIDWGCSDNIVQYNYGHDAAGYCVSVFGAHYTTTNSIVRFNVCSDNARAASKAGQGDIYLATWDGGSIDGVQIYNNTVYWNPAADAYAVNFDGRGTRLTGSGPRLFKNNIVYSGVPKLVTTARNTGIDLDHNVYWYTGVGNPEWNEDDETSTSLAVWQGRGYDLNSFYQDPVLMNPVAHPIGGPGVAFNPRGGSPAIDAGTDVGDMGGRDFHGDPVPYGGAYDIGAVEWRPGPRGEDSRGPGSYRRAAFDRAGSCCDSQSQSLELRRARGGVLSLDEIAGDPVLLSFVNVGPDGGASRSQVVFLRSMNLQYVTQGLQVVIVEVGGPTDGRLQNTAYDWDLGEIPLLEGHPGMADRYGVWTVPTTLLFDAGGVLRERWEGFVLPARLAQSVRRLLAEDGMVDSQGST